MMPTKDHISNGYLDLNTENFPPADIIQRDVCIIGGGSSGTYTAIRLRDFQKSVVVIEPRAKLGGHAETYRDPKTGATLDIGVIVFGHLDEVKHFFARYNIPLKIAQPGLPNPRYVDFSTGKELDFTPPSPAAVGAAFQRYAAQAMKYPEVQAGFNLTYPVNEDLLMPFGKYVEKYDLGDLINTVFAICQGYTPLLELSTLYVMKYFTLDLLISLSKGFIMTERDNVGELYEKAAAELGSDVLLNTSLLKLDRSSDTGPAKILVQTPSGQKLILAKKIVSAIPLNLSNLGAFDLSSDEESLFGQYFHSAFYAGVLRNTGLPTTAPFYSASSRPPYMIPELPGIYMLNPHPPTGLVQVYYGSPREIPTEQVKADIIAAVQRLQKERNVTVEGQPEFVSWANHVPFNMMVSNEAIQAGFYQKLEALQGQRHTWFNGASVHTQDSSLLWRYTEELLPRIIEGLNESGLGLILSRL